MNERSFVHEVADRVECDDRRAETLTFAVFQELRDRLTPEEAAKVAAQLPGSLKMLWLSFDRPHPIGHIDRFAGSTSRAFSTKWLEWLASTTKPTPIAP